MEYRVRNTEPRSAHVETTHFQHSVGRRGQIQKEQTILGQGNGLSDLSKSNVEVLMEAAQVLYPRDNRESETWRIGIKRWPEAS